ncbi:aromatic ring-opening dioxygenase catalytic subunit (LigB family) [Bradyrhizobium sp. GM24.11]
MAHVIAGIGGSHSPSVARAFDGGPGNYSDWTSYFETYASVKRWLATLKPDLAIVFYNDHLNSLTFDQYPTFAVGASDFYPLANEGEAPRPFSGVKGDTEFAWHLGETLIADSFDPSICQQLPIDHGVMTVLPLLFDQPWPVSIVPISINVIQHPLPRPDRCFRLGQAVRHAIETDGTDKRVVVIGTGGLSHHLQGADFGYINPEWDEQFMDLIERDPEKLSAMSIADYLSRGGSEGVEVIIWLAMRGALGSAPRRAYRNYHAGLLTGCGVLALEDGSTA